MKLLLFTLGAAVYSFLAMVCFTIMSDINEDRDFLDDMKLHIFEISILSIFWPIYIFTKSSVLFFEMFIRKEIK